MEVFLRSDLSNIVWMINILLSMAKQKMLQFLIMSGTDLSNVKDSRGKLRIKVLLHLDSEIVRLSLFIYSFIMFPFLSSLH